MRILFTLVAVACLALTGCQSVQFGNVLTAACSQRHAYIAPVQLLADAGELSPNNLQRFENAKIAVEATCANPPQDVASAALTVTSLYLTLRNIKKE